VLLPPQSPNLNAHLERFHRSLKEECLERMIFFGETALRNAVREYVDTTIVAREIIRDWPTRSSPQVTRWAQRAARSSAVSGLAACCDTTIARPRDLRSAPTGRDSGVRLHPSWATQRDPRHLMLPGPSQPMRSLTRRPKFGRRFR